MPLINSSSRSIFWRIFDNRDNIRAAGISSAFEGVIPSGGQVAIGYVAGPFQLEIRDRPLPSFIPPSNVLVPAGPPRVVGRLYRASDTIEYAGGTSVRLATQEKLDVPRFLPSTHGFKFSNAFPKHTPHTTIRVGPADLAIGDAHKGLCGGMVYAVRDYYHAGLRVPPHRVGPIGGVLYDYLVARLYDSFALPLGWTEYLRLMSRSCEPGERARTAYFTAMNAIEADIRRGWPSPIGLIQVITDDPFKVGENHQVLVYGYEKNGTAIRLKIYDPNYPEADDITLSFDTNQFPASFQYSRRPGGDGRILSFFCHQYQMRQPPGVSQIPPWVDLPQRDVIAEGTSNIVLANGGLGLLRIDRIVGDNFYGTMFGDPMQGQVDRSREVFQFTRTINSQTVQRYRGGLQRDSDTHRLTGTASGIFLQETQGVAEPEEFEWRAASRLLVDGHGWNGEILLNTLDSKGGLAGTIYGDTLTGNWDHLSRRISFTRGSADPNYRQEWSGTLRDGLTFGGEFQQVFSGQRHPEKLRWAAYDR